MTMIRLMKEYSDGDKQPIVINPAFIVTVTRPEGKATVIHMDERSMSSYQDIWVVETVEEVMKLIDNASKKEL